MKTMDRLGSSYPLPCSTRQTAMKMPCMYTARTGSLTSEKSEEQLSPSGTTRGRLIRAGKWAGMTAVSVGLLMGCSTWTAKRYLYKYKPVDLEEVGKLVQVYRNERERRSVGSLLNWGSRSRM